jgi:ferredoxin/flavodoxin---NADP+ reductase
VSYQAVDIAIVGAGPTGLYATYYAGFRGLSVALIDSLPELGGQVTAMYPEKLIYDVAGFPEIKGRDLIAGLARQAQTADPLYLLGRTVRDLNLRDELIELTLEDEQEAIQAKAVIITAGIGKFAPRTLPAGLDWEGRGLAYFVPEFAPYKGKDVVIVGGGDSAFDWADQLESVAHSITLVHRRKTFRAHEGTVQKVLGSSVRVITSAEVSTLHGNTQLECVAITTEDGSSEVIACQKVIAALGFVADLGPMTRWGLSLKNRHILVNSAMCTNLPRVFAAGDINEYPGKVRLIAVGFGEAATAINNAAVVLDPTAHVFPGHSSNT